MYCARTLKRGAADFPPPCVVSASAVSDMPETPDLVSGSPAPELFCVNPFWYIRSCRPRWQPYDPTLSRLGVCRRVPDGRHVLVRRRCGLTGLGLIFRNIRIFGIYYIIFAGKAAAT